MPLAPRTVTAATSDAGTVLRTERLASLWAGYGTISRLHLSTVSSLVLKTIVPPPLSGGFDESNARKLTSYDVERFFYRRLAPSLPPSARVAKSFPLREGMNPAENLLLEDLDVEFDVDGSGSYYTLAQTHAVLTWLASFHSTFSPPPASLFLHPAPSSSASSGGDGIWATGTYSYLATRMSEFASLPATHYLRTWAPYVDARLGDSTQAGWTILHGDVKSANIAFARAPGPAEPKCALYDFQYVGTGLGVRDVVYFLSTSVSPHLLAGDGYDQLLRFYWDQLEIAGYEWEVCKRHAEWAVVDWARFLQSWGEWGNARWVAERSKEFTYRWTKEGIVP